MSDRLRLWGPLLAASILAAMPAQAQPTIPSTFVFPSTAADLSKPGFIWRVHQVATLEPNTNPRTDAQLAGLLGENIADPNVQGIALAPSSPPAPATAPIGFEISTVINLSVFGGEYNGNFVPDDQMPGVPGTTGSPNFVAAEVLTWLDLPAGNITLGVNSDDGFRMSIGGFNPSDQFAVKVGEFNGGRGASDTLFTFNVPQAGLYAAHCTWEQGVGGANLEIFSIKADGTPALVNDIANGGIAAYRAVTSAPRAFARKVSPAPNAGAIGPNAPIIVELVDGPVAIDPATIKLSVDGTEVTVLRSKTGNVTTTTYSTAKLNRPGSQHDVAFTYAEGGSPITVTWSFTVANYVGPNGNFYEFVSAPAIPWEDAKAAAEQRTLCGQPGHLATITSPDEDVYLQFLWEESVAGGAFAREAWTGGFQLPNQATPNDGWMWINGEGPIEGFTGGSTYAGWFFGEPNDCCQSLYFEDNEENYLGIGVFGVLGWNDDGNGHLDNIGGYIVEYERPPVTIDIKPGASPNVVYLDSNGKLPVAILSSPAFNAATVDPSSIRFGKTGTEAAPASYSLEDVNKDGRKDLLCHFNTQDTGLLCGDSTALLLASTYAGCPIRGSDSIQALRCAPYVLSVEAMQDVHHLTDIYLKVTTVLQGYTAPAAAQSVQLKSFDIFGHLRWTKAFQNVALTPNPGPNPTNFSSADLQFTDVEHYQRVKAQLGVRNSQNGNVQILRQEGVVLLRPDLTVDRVDVLGSAYAQQIVNISASIKELNGDLGGAATVYLMEGANVLDVARGVFVGPRGNVGVIFSAIFTQTGAHALTVVIGDETPGDYDLSNNDKSFTIDVLQQPAFHYANYHHSDFEFLEEQDNPYWTSRNYQKGASEELSEQLYIPVALNFPVEQLTIQISADGTLRNDIRLADIPADSSFTYDNCYTFSTVSLNLDDGFTLYIQSERSTCYGGNYQQSYASLYKQAYDYVFYSSYHDKYWGTTIEDSGAPKLGNLLSASLSLQIRFVLEDDGSAYGGTADLSLFSYPYDEAWDFEYPDWGYDRGYSRGTQSYGASSGFLTP